MNGTDSIFAVLTVLVILVFAPLWQFKDLTDEMRRAAFKEIVREKDPDAGYVLKAAEILDMKGRLTAITLEGKRNAELYPYIFIESIDEENENNEKGRLTVYGF